MSDSEIVSLAKRQQEHFGELYERYFERIFRFIYRRLGGLEDTAGDLAQQTFMKAMANLEKYEDRGLPFVSWLYRIAQNEVSMYFRSLKKVRTVEIEERKLKDLFEEAELSGRMTIEEQEKLIGLLNGMEQENLDIIELRFFQGLSFKEIADIYSINEASAKMRLYSILERLGKKWNESK